jgi:hypothetical protein
MAKLTEKQFLIGLALRRFNEQYSRNIQVADCDIASIPLRFGFQRSYEINTTRIDDNLRLHMHIRFEGKDALSNYRVEVDSILTQFAISTGTLSDEVYVTTGTIDPHYLNQDIYKFRLLNENPLDKPVLLIEENFSLLLESGNEILLESE